MCEPCQRRSRVTLGLATFTGSVCRRYGGVQLPRLLEYVANQLKRDNVTDLIVLKELVTKLAGVESNDITGEAQLEAMAGGPVLRAEVQPCPLPSPRSRAGPC